MNASRLSCRVRSAIAEPFYAGLVVGPAAAHLDPHFQIDLAAEKLFHVESGRRRDALQLPAARSDDDRLVSFLFIPASLGVGKEGDKTIIIGAGGGKLKSIATAARLDMEKLFGGKVYLEVWVKVRRGWTDDEASVKRLGYG